MPFRFRFRGAVVVAAVLTFAAAAMTAAAHPAGPVPVGQLVGQRLVVAMEGLDASPSLLRRIEAGEIGGVILFAANAASAPQLRALTRTLHDAAARAGRPPLLVFADQEGGIVRRFRWAPPAATAAMLGARSLAYVESAGHQTGRALKTLGVDVDLAPVADVPAPGPSFLRTQGRAYGATPERVASRAAAFARGLAAAGVLATAKHFPGLGRAEQSTDLHAVTLEATRGQLKRDLDPFRRLVNDGVALVMLANATYPALDNRPAVWSATAHRLLRGQLAFSGVTISDALEPLALTHGLPVETAALRAAQASTDLLLLTGPESRTARVHAALVEAARDGLLARVGLDRSYRRLVALKTRHAG